MLDSGAKTSVTAIPGQSGAAMVRDYMGRNHGAWLSIADFIVRENFRSVFASQAARTAEGAPPRGEVAGRAASAAINFGGCVALETSSGPDGNHGDNLARGAA